MDKTDTSAIQFTGLGGDPLHDVLHGGRLEPEAHQVRDGRSALEITTPSSALSSTGSRATCPGVSAAMGTLLLLPSGD
jgi:hypothetical protein